MNKVDYKTFLNIINFTDSVNIIANLKEEELNFLYSSWKKQCPEDKPNKTVSGNDVMEYSIIPISFEDYDEYVSMLNEYGEDGWVFGAMIRVYEDSPVDGKTTHDFICSRKKE